MERNKGKIGRFLTRHLRQRHWNRIFSRSRESELGWYETDLSQTLKVLDAASPAAGAIVFLPGAGTSGLVEILRARGHRLILNDISDEALNKLRSRTGEDERLIWLHQDISEPLPDEIPRADVWIDRAVLHFLCDEKDIRGYFHNLCSGITGGGYALLAEFSTGGAHKCAGLPVHRYSLQEMTERMGAEFELVMHEDFSYITPWGDPRPYLYALYRKKNG